MIYSPPTPVTTQIQEALGCDELWARAVEKHLQTTGFDRLRLTESEFRQLVHRVDALFRM